MEFKGRFGGDELRLPSSLAYTAGTTTSNKGFPAEPFSTSPSPSPGAPPPTATAATPTSRLREATFPHGNGVSTAVPPDPIQTTLAADPLLLPSAPTRTSSASTGTPPPPPPAAAATANHVRTPPAAATTPRRTPSNVRYRECLKNHAAAVGGHVVDGCGEFMSGGPGAGEGEDEFRCSVCGCHRSFHRKEVEGETAPAAAASSYHRHPYYYHHLATANGGGRVPQPPPLLALPPPPSRPLNPTPMMSFGGRAGNESGGGGGGMTTDSSSEEMDAHTPVAAGGELQRMVFSSLVPPPPAPSVLSRKRSRTKFTAEQRERMASFAEAMGWRMQRKDDAALEQLCAEIGVSRQVFKVWMHNNKHISTARKLDDDQHQQQPQQQQQQQPTPP